MSTTRDVAGQSDITKMKPEEDGSFKRRASSFRRFIKKGGEFEPEKGRYHLYVSYACPWATRTLITRVLKGLENFIDVSIVSPHMGCDGWPFANVDAFPGATTDPLHNAEHVKDLYLRADPEYDGRFTVPVLWDKKTGTIVNNESSEIIRMFNSAFNALLPADKAAVDIYPEAHRAEIDGINEWVYDTVNNGVYKAGFASTQAAYEAAVVPLFASLDRLEKMLTGKDYLVGDRLTEADVRLFVTILYWNNPAFSMTCNFEHIKTHYYWSHTFINPHRVIPVGPIPNILPL
ncbi:Glutathione S-transferase omega-like 2 [Grifola frondosa]|uniref:Glutathione S-transferase omega-like 2 n=1 Tax=Grifola frondosa TaxID=5627 RepID=A0A1C7LS40_GRIFR|nr:Glutathione S-transferase omega-like 2 [Grifola frondosa]